MLSNKKIKKVLIYIIISLLIFSIISFIITKVVYDNLFPRYDCSITEYSDELQDTISLRSQITYPCDGHNLSGFLYESSVQNKKDCIIVLAPGHNACSEDYLWQIHELLELGWSVFAFDPTGTCHSEGDSSVGFSQEVLDLRATLDHLKRENNFGFSKLALLGHSRGGYAVCCSLAYDYDVSAVISVSGVNSAMEGIIGTSANYVGPLAYGNYGFLWLYQTMLFGSETVNLRADEIIAETDTPVLLIHGEDDQSIPADKYSIVSHKENLTTPNTQIVIRSAPDNSGHTNLLFAKDGTADDEVIKEIDNFLIKCIK